MIVDGIADEAGHLLIGRADSHHAIAALLARVRDLVAHPTEEVVLAHLVEEHAVRPVHHVEMAAELVAHRVPRVTMGRVDLEAHRVVSLKPHLLNLLLL